MSKGGYGAFRLYRRLLREARPYWPHIGGVSLVNLLATPIALLSPVPLKVAVDSIIGSAPFPTFYQILFPVSVLQSTIGALIVTAILMVAVGFLEQLQSYGGWLLGSYVGERLVLEFRAKLFRHLQRLSLAYHDRQGTTDSMYRIQYDAPAIQSIAVGGIVPFVSAMLTLSAMLYVVARLDWQLAVVAFVTMPVLFWMTHLSASRLKGSWKEVKRLESSAMSVLQEVLGSIRVVTGFAREDHEQRRFVDKSSLRLTHMMRVLMLQLKFDASIALLISTATAVTLGLGILHVKSGTLTLGNLLLVIAYLGQLYGPMRNISKNTNQLQSALAGAERAFTLLDRVPDVTEKPGAQRIAQNRGSIEFRKVTFGYDTNTPVVRDASFTIEPGTRVGIVGPTGVGKTTLLNLLTRFYDPTVGQVLLDGVDLRDLNLTDLRNQFAIVLQDPVLFSTSIADNIAYARPDASQEDIERAARAANAHEFISSLAEGYATVVGERGMRLSGGERQRISVARAFLKDAPILLLDEPTSSVDMKTESAIMEALDRLMSGRTTFMIAHRLSTLTDCDVWLELSRGLGGATLSVEHHLPGHESKVAQA